LSEFNRRKISLHQVFMRFFDCKSFEIDFH
jgi:hypothetical protein